MGHLPRSAATAAMQSIAAYLAQSAGAGHRATSQRNSNVSPRTTPHFPLRQVQAAHAIAAGPNG